MTTPEKDLLARDSGASLPPMRRSLFLLGALILLVATLSGCAWRHTDRRWVSDRRFHQVWEVYQERGSVEGIRRLLERQPWRPGEINECLYRIEQIERARAMYDPVRFPPRGEPRPPSGTSFQLGT